MLGEFAVKIKDVVKEGIFSKSPAVSKTDSEAKHWTDKWQQQIAVNRRYNNPERLQNYVATIVGSRIDANDIPVPTDAETQSPVATKNYITNWVKQYYNVAKGDIYKPPAAAPAAGTQPSATPQQTQTTPVNTTQTIPTPGTTTNTSTGTTQTVPNVQVQPTPQPAIKTPRIFVDKNNVQWVKDVHDGIWRSAETGDEADAEDGSELDRRTQAQADAHSYTRTAPPNAPLQDKTPRKAPRKAPLTPNSRRR